MYQLKEGNIFDSKCDLVIIPCNTNGGVSDSIYDGLLAINITRPRAKGNAGSVRYQKAPRGHNYASVIGFAATVNIDGSKESSTIEIINEIADSIIDYCLAQSLTIINLPLLGTGAGGLEAEEVFDCLRKKFENEDQLNAIVHVVSSSVFTKLNKKINYNTLGTKNPRVFVSYTGKDSKNQIWVRKLVKKLRDSGVDAIVDFFHLKPGMDLPQWMTNQLIMADKVLLICDKNYTQKADSRDESSGGVGWETMIIQGDMLVNSNTNKYIAIAREEDFNKSIPLYAKSRYALHWVDYEITDGMDEKFKELLFALFECDTIPSLGKIPDEILEKIGSKNKM